VAAVAALTVLGTGPNASTGVVKLPPVPVLGVAGLLVEPGPETRRRRGMLRLSCLSLLHCTSEQQRTDGS
jgi:hypothetical protein